MPRAFWIASICVVIAVMLLDAGQLLAQPVRLP